MLIRSSQLFGRLSLFVVLASGLGCSATPRAAAPSFSFRPTVPGATLWLATPIAVEVVTEREARELEVVDPMYVGEIDVRGGHVRGSEVALMAADKGATHFRIVSDSATRRVDVVLFRVERERWSALPESLRPAPPAGPPLPSESHAEL